MNEIRYNDFDYGHKEIIMAFQVFTDSSSELLKEHRKEYGIEYFRQGITINEDQYHADLDWEEYSPEQLYAWVGDLKNRCKTSLVTFEEFTSKMIPYLEKGIDILYIACARALSATVEVFKFAQEEMLEKYPDRKIIAIDSCRAEYALGMLVIEASKMQKEGKSIEETAKWVEENKQYYHEVGSVETLTYLKAAGRVSGAAAFFGNMISLKPIVIFDIHGNNYAVKKVRGNKAALEECYQYIKDNIVEGVTDTIYIGQAMAQDRQAWLKEKIENELHIPVKDYWIGPIVGISCGPGMYGVYFKGKLVTADSQSGKK